MVKRDEELPKFFKVYSAEIYSERMRIPPDFIEKFGGNVPTIVTLKTKSGTSLQADVNKIDDCWFLEKGWPEFVKENSLEEGDFMTFSYAGNSVFHVKIFAINGCIKGIFDLTDNEVSATQSENLSPRMRLGRESNGGNRSFSVVMNNSYLLKGLMHVPNEFSKAHLRKDERRMVTLWIKKKSWNVGLATSSDAVIFSRGWAKFVKDNSLKNGNVCTFRLFDSSDSAAFNVTIDK